MDPNEIGFVTKGPTYASIQSYASNIGLTVVPLFTKRRHCRASSVQIDVFPCAFDSLQEYQVKSYDGHSIDLATV